MQAATVLIAEPSSSNRRCLLHSSSSLLVPDHASTEEGSSMTLNHSPVLLKRWPDGKISFYIVSILSAFGVI